MAHTSTPQHTAAAGAIGNAMEWYDFAIYGYMAPFISNLFFPSGDELESLLAVYGAFAAGYLARPLGGMVFGHIGDAIGRRFMMMISVLVMGVCTIAIGLLPTYDDIGPLAGVLLVSLRVLQGLSVGGEYTGSAVFVAERAPDRLRGFLTSFVMAGATAGFLLGSAVSAALTNLYSAEEMSAFVWRVPFLSSIVLMAVGILIRRALTEEEADAPTEDLGRSPVIYAFRHHKRDILRVAGLALGPGTGFYILFVFSISYLTDRMHVSAADAMDINTLCMVVLVVMPIASAAASDVIGRKAALLVPTVIFILATIPLWTLMHHSNLTLVLLGQLGFAVSAGWIFGVNPVAMAESVPQRVRVSVMSVGYNVTLAFFGGTAPAVATYLIERTGDDFAPAYYLMVLSAISLCVIFTLRETARRPLA